MSRSLFHASERRKAVPRAARVALAALAISTTVALECGAARAWSDAHVAPPILAPDGVIDAEFLADLERAPGVERTSHRRLGETLAADGELLAIASPTDGDDALSAGRVAIVQLRPPAGGSASALRTITPIALLKSQESGDHFGCALALRRVKEAGSARAATSTLLAVGADRAAGLTGAVELFWIEPEADAARGDATTPATTVHVATLSADDPQPGAEFGRALALGRAAGAPPLLAVGAPRHDLAGAFDAGRVHLFRPARSPSGPTDPWMACATITAPDPASSAWFGTAVALGAEASAHTILAVGCPGEGAHGGASSPGGRRSPAVDGAGAIHLYAIDAHGHATWLTRLQSPSPEPHAWFGSAIAIDGTALLVGEPRGSHAGLRCGRVWRFDLTALDRPAVPLLPTQGSDPAALRAWLQPGMGFGSAIAARDGVVIVGAPGFDAPLALDGAAMGGIGTSAADCPPPTPPRARATVEDTGLAFVFEHGATSPDRILAGPSPLPMSLFGPSAALIPRSDGSGCTAAIGHLYLEEEAHAPSPGVALFDLPRAITPEAPQRPPDTSGRACASTAPPSRSR